MIAEPVTAIVQTVDHEEQQCVSRARDAVLSSAWIVGQCAAEWTQRYANGRTDADFGQLICLSADQVQKRRRVWERFGESSFRVNAETGSLSWTHLAEAVGWDDADKLLTWAIETGASSLAMRDEKRSRDGRPPRGSLDPPAMPGHDAGGSTTISIARPDGSRAALDFSSGSWIRSMLSHCDDPRRHGRPGKIRGLYPYGLLALDLRREGYAFSEIALMLGRDKGNLFRVMEKTVSVLKGSLEVPEGAALWQAEETDGFFTDPDTDPSDDEPNTIETSTLYERVGRLHRDVAAALQTVDPSTAETLQKCQVDLQKLHAKLRELLSTSPYNPASRDNPDRDAKPSGDWRDLLDETELAAYESGRTEDRSLRGAGLNPRSGHREPVRRGAVRDRNPARDR